MDSKFAQDEKMYFSERLKASLKAAGLSLRASDFARAFNALADGSAVTRTRRANGSAAKPFPPTKRW